MEFIEPALDGKDLYETTVSLAWVYDGNVGRSWEQLTWNERDAWEARADEINESRRSND